MRALFAAQARTERYQAAPEALTSAPHSMSLPISVSLPSLAA